MLGPVEIIIPDSHGLPTLKQTYPAIKYTKNLLKNLDGSTFQLPSNTYFEDISETYLEDGSLGYEHDVHYRVLAKDNQGLESLPSKSVSATVEGALLEKNGTHELNMNRDITYNLEPNYPNPF
jgi:hypothetical protein